MPVDLSVSAVADALCVSPGDVRVLLADVVDSSDDGPLPEWAASWAHALLDVDGARSVPEAYSPPEYRLSDEWRSLGPGGPADDDPGVV